MAKEKLSLSGVDKWRKDEKKKLAKKIKKERDERKETKLNQDPQALKQELDRLRGVAQGREAAGSNAQMKRKIDELAAVHAEAEKRAAAKTK